MKVTSSWKLFRCRRFDIESEPSEPRIGFCATCLVPFVLADEVADCSDHGSEMTLSSTKTFSGSVGFSDGSARLTSQVFGGSLDSDESLFEFSELVVVVAGDGGGADKNGGGRGLVDGEDVGATTAKD